MNSNEYRDRIRIILHSAYVIRQDISKLMEDVGDAGTAEWDMLHGVSLAMGSASGTLYRVLDPMPSALIEPVTAATCQIRAAHPSHEKCPGTAPEFPSEKILDPWALDKPAQSNQLDV